MASCIVSCESKTSNRIGNRRKSRSIFDIPLTQ